MQISQDLKTFFDHLARSSEATDAALADNYRFEQRVTTQRWQDFNTFITGKAEELDTGNFREALKDYIDNKINVTKIPDTFLEINRSAWKEGLTEDTLLVRIEDLTRPLKLQKSGNIEENYNELQRNLMQTKKAKQEQQQSVKSFFDDWNKKRDKRPVFAALYDNVQEEYEDADWPHALQRCLGLGDFKGEKNPIPVALMRYSLAEVLHVQKKNKLPVACVLPTAFESNSPFFFPSPIAYPFGATLHLDPAKPNILTPEILHCRIDYEPKHLIKIGFISESCVIDKDDILFRRTRDQHLFALREASQQHDFGEEMMGRI